MKTIYLLITASIFSLTQVSFGQDMGAAPVKKKSKSRSEITSASKQEYTNVQKKYQDQIVFSNSKIGKTDANPANFITTWDMRESLFHRVYQSNTLMEGVYDYKKAKGEEFNEYYYADFATLTVVYINGKEMGTREAVFSGKKELVTEWVTYSGFISNPAKPKKSSADIGQALKRAFHAMGDDYKEGTVDVKIEIYAVSSELDDPRVKRHKSDRSSLLSSGMLKVKITKEGMKKFAPTLCYGIMKNGSSMVDVDLEKKAMVKFSETYGKPTAANITSEDWRIVKNSFGIPLRRNLSTKITYLDKENKHNIIDYYINQTYNGNGYQKSVNTSSVGASRRYSPYCVTYKQELIKVN